MGKYLLYIQNILNLFYSFSYPPMYIHNQFINFFTFHLSPSFILPKIYSQTDFALIRSVLVTTPTIPEYQMASRIAGAVKNEPQQEVDNSLVRAELRKQSKSNTNLTIHYTREKRLKNHKHHIHQL